MSIKNPKQSVRKNGEKTRERIIRAAKALFAQKGFAGTSISQIAKKARLPHHSLIFHHFKNKEELWKAVKISFVESLPNELKEQVDASKGLHHFISQIVRQRCELYDKNPDLIRIITWQYLENENLHLRGGTRLSPDHWIEPILQLQKKGAIRSDLDVESIMAFIVSMLLSIYLSKFPLFKDAQKKQRYIQMVIEGLYDTLRNK